VHDHRGNLVTAREPGGGPRELELLQAPCSGSQPPYGACSEIDGDELAVDIHDPAQSEPIVGDPSADLETVGVGGWGVVSPERAGG
jgi:hypothetical protein